MSINPSVPDYELLDTLELTTPAQVRAISDQLRTTVIGLLHERAATVTELATALQRPKSTVAHHVNVLLDAGLITVVRTRRVRAIDERYYGRTARMFYIGLGERREGDVLPLDFNDFEVAAKESAAAYANHQLWSFIRHARIGPDDVARFWQRITELVQEFDQTPRSGDTVYGFTVGIYPTRDFPVLPPASATTDRAGSAARDHAGDGADDHASDGASDGTSDEAGDGANDGADRDPIS